MTAPVAGTFLQQFCGFSGPARAILDRDLTGEIILPPTEGDAVVSMNEDIHEVTFNETGSTPREVYSVGQRFEISYPMKYALLEVMGMAMTGDNYAMDDTAAPSGTDGSGNALVARKTVVNSFQYCHKKTERTLDIWRIADPPFDASGDEVARAEDFDRFGIHFPHSVILAPNGEAFSFGIKTTVYTMRFLAVNPVGSADPLMRMFNTDLALA